MATTSGTSTFNLDVVTLCEEAYERAGLEMRNGYDLRTARRSLSLMALELQNRGLNLFTVASGSQALTAGTATYSLGSDIIDLIEFFVRKGTGTSQIDYQLNRISVSSYAQRTNKNTRSRPTDIYIERKTDGVSVTVWPVPDDATWTLEYYYMRRIEDLGENTNNFDAPEIFIPAICAGLAYHIAVKRPESEARIPLLKSMYDEALHHAFSENREKADWRIIPQVRRL